MNKYKRKFILRMPGYAQEREIFADNEAHALELLSLWLEEEETPMTKEEYLASEADAMHKEAI